AVLAWAGPPRAGSGGTGAAPSATARAGAVRADADAEGTAWAVVTGAACGDAARADAARAGAPRLGLPCFGGGSRSFAGGPAAPAATTTIGSGSPRIHTRARVTAASMGRSRPRKRTWTRWRRPVRTTTASCDRTAARVAMSQNAVNCLPDTYPADVPS